MKQVSAAIYNLGCKVNAYEAEAMAEALCAAGFSVVPFSEKADVYIINTCTVTNTADQKSRQIMHRAKKQNPDAVIAAAGCYGHTHEKPDAVIDLIVTNEDKPRIASILGTYLKAHGLFSAKAARTGTEGAAFGAAEAVSADKEETAGASVQEVSTVHAGFQGAPHIRGIRTMQGHTRAFVKIEDGCDSFCAYCVIPFARGRVKSRCEEDIVLEVQRLARAGYWEVVLTGIQVNAYGTDRSGGPPADAEMLKLITRLSGIEGLARIRLSSMEVRLVTERFLDGVSRIGQFCPHFHLSLQSGCDKTLKAMNRRYTTADYASACARIRKRYPLAAITTDLITGFPGETEEDFEETLQFLKKTGFYQIHVFPYSRRKGTRADAMSGQLPAAVKKARAARARAVGEELEAAFLRRHIKEKLTVLWEETKDIRGEACRVGHAENYVRCAILKKQAPQTGEITTVTGTNVLDRHLMCVP